MPISTFSSFTDGLDSNRRSREHFITNINLNEDRLWVPYADGVWFQPCLVSTLSFRAYGPAKPHENHSGKIVTARRGEVEPTVEKLKL